MVKLHYSILAALFLSHCLIAPTYARVGDFYICEDVDEEGDFKSQFVLNWDDQHAHMKFLANEEVEGIEISDRILFQNENSFIAINPEDDGGLSTFSFYEDVEGIVTLRTFVESNRTFSKSATCTIKQMAETKAPSVEPSSQ